uniref:V-type proton ATPase subunit a n=1 Tax=Sinocyclocheilus grahami TaxID=75366 RepID=A0A672L1Y9_SINGR
MGSLFRSEEVCLVQIFLQSGSAYNCVSELGELGIVEFRDLNPNVNAFQRKYVNEVRRCEELEKTFGESSLMQSVCDFTHVQVSRNRDHHCNILLVFPQGEEVQWTVFLISFWGDQIGQKVKKICDCFHTQTFPYPESQAEREETLNGLRGRIEDIKSVMGETEQYMQQLLVRALARLPEWIVQVQKCKAVQTVLNLCSPSVTDKCLIAEAWCPVSQLPALQSALREGGRKSGSSVDSFYNRLPATTSPPTLFPTNAFTAGFQNIVDAYGVASYREMNPAVYTIITFPFLFAVMFGDVGHGLLMTLLALWMVLEEKDSKLRKNTNEIWQMMFGGRYLILLMGLFSIYTGAIYNECFSRGLNTFSSGWHIRPNAEFYNWTEETFKSNQYLSLDPNVTGVFTGPYPFGVDPIWGLANNHLTFLNSYKMKMSVIIGVIHMTFGVCLSLFNYM